MDKTAARWPVIAFCIAGAAMAAGAYLGFLAWKQGSLTFGLSAAVLLLSAPAIAVTASLAFMSGIAEDSEQPLARIDDDHRRAGLALRTIRMARANALVAVSYAVVLVFCQWNGMIDAAAFVWTFSALCVLATASYLPWLARRETQVREQLATCRRARSEWQTGLRRGLSP